MIHIDPLFYKQTPKFDLGKSCPVLCYLYILKKNTSVVQEIFLMQTCTTMTFIYIGQNQKKIFIWKRAYCLA